MKKLILHEKSNTQTGRDKTRDIEARGTGDLVE